MRCAVRLLNMQENLFALIDYMRVYIKIIFHQLIYKFKSWLYAKDIDDMDIYVRQLDENK